MSIRQPDIEFHDELLSGSASTLDEWARELGVTAEVMERLVVERRGLVYDVAADPRAWGFDLVAAGAPRRDVASELSRRARLQGRLGESFIAGHAPLLELVPEPPTMPDGTPLPTVLVATASLTPDAARAVAANIRTVIQRRLGRPIDSSSIEVAVTEAGWEHGLEVHAVVARVLEAMRHVS